MVTALLDEIRTAPFSPAEAAYAERGYHWSAAVAAGSLREAVAWLDTRGFYLEDLCCVDWTEQLELVYFFNRHEAPCRIKLSLRTAAAVPQAPSIGDIFPNAVFYEREVHEFFGLVFEGHPDLSFLFLHEAIDAFPLRKARVAHTADDRARLLGKAFEQDPDSFSLNLGPQHPSTHGVLQLIVRMDGEYLLDVRPVLGYEHRMHEKMGENRPYLQFMPNTARMDYAGAISYNLAYVTAVERLAGIAVPPRAQYIRVICTELNRMSSHFIWLGAFLADLGALTPFLYTFDDREQVLDLLESVAGSRLTYCYFRFGGVSNDVDDSFLQGAAAFARHMRERLKMYEKLIGGNVIFQHRAGGIGVISREEARKYGVSGPVLRASGVPWDLRRSETYSSYGDFGFDVFTGADGDALGRYRMRLLDFENSCRIIEEAVARIPAGPVKAEKVPKKIKPPAGDLYHPIEGARGEVGVYLVSDGGDKPYRMHWRVPSFPHLMIVPHLARGLLLSDAIAAMGSLDLVIPEIDR